MRIKLDTLWRILLVFTADRRAEIRELLIWRARAQARVAGMSATVDVLRQTGTRPWRRFERKLAGWEAALKVASAEIDQFTALERVYAVLVAPPQSKQRSDK